MVRLVHECPGYDRAPAGRGTIEQATSLDELGQTGRAVQLLTGLVAEFSHASAIHGYLGHYLSGTGQHDDAVLHSQQAVNLSPRSEKASHVHFHALWRAGRWSEAFDETKRFVRIRPAAAEYRSLIDGWRRKDDDDEATLDRVTRILTS